MGGASSSRSRTPGFVNYGAQSPSPYNGRFIANRQFQLGMPGVQGMPQQTGYNMDYIRRPPNPRMNFQSPAQMQQKPNPFYSMFGGNVNYMANPQAYYSPQPYYNPNGWVAGQFDGGGGE